MNPMRVSPVRRTFLQFLVAVALVHLAAIALYYGLGIARSPAETQRWFGWVWMAVTVAVVIVGLQRIKRARRAARTSG